MAPQPEVTTHFRQYLRSFLGVIRILQILIGAGLWVTIALNRYEGPIHFVLFVAVLFWLLTVAAFFITLLDKQDLVPVVGGDRWLLSNLFHDVAAVVMYVPAIGIMIYKTERYEYCNLKQYEHPCLYKVYVAVSVFACLGAMVYLISAVHLGCKKCRGEQTVM
ncbi:hypothetical protein DPEC_G00033230 [Dallia pectoralis]|uniref:Uncharacterized protein n=1 Tax=Dallia pectoralis TaxID=75939 RepID=A0ACC2HCR1_DALPE|nr:hypothetical protein DPEC_G00033230 [Dallia pectoralis]